MFINKRLATLFFSTVFLWGSPALAVEEGIEYSIAKGGRLYDKWFRESSMDTPKMANPSYPEGGNYRGKKGADWRCKECHGWDYRGAEGAYSKGKHATGIKGIRASSSFSAEKVAALLRDANHGYSREMIGDEDVRHLTNFIRSGMVDTERYIDDASKKVVGDSGKGGDYYQTLCASCHGLDGRAEETPPLGQLTNKNPWEVLHKIRNGQPAEEMPAYRALDIQITLDIMAYMQEQLPKEEK